jgi:hypothetical protein
MDKKQRDKPKSNEPKKNEAQKPQHVFYKDRKSGSGVTFR